MAEQANFKDLLGTGAHFGHVTRKWHPNYEPFILMERNGVHIINLEETVKRLSTATDFIKNIVKKNGEVLFVGTKKQAQDIVQQEADRCSMFYIVERWLGGTLTNFATIKKSIKRLKALEKEGSSIYDNLTKKEIQMLNRERLKLSDQHRGIKDMRRLPDAIVIVDVERESTALLEAIKLEIPVVAIIDTNCDPRIVNYPIPANDDSIRTIQLIISSIVDGIIETQEGEAIAAAVAKEEEILRKEAQAKAAADEKAMIEKRLKAKAVKLEEKKPDVKAKPVKEVKTEVKKEAKPTVAPKKASAITDPKKAPVKKAITKTTKKATASKTTIKKPVTKTAKKTTPKKTENK